MTPEMTVLVLLAGIICIAMEIYLPGGFMGLAGGALLIWAIVEAYRFKTDFGTMLLVCGVGGSVAASWFSFTYLSKTKEGKKALLMDANIELPEDRHKGLEGKTGVTLTDMRPSGLIEIDGERYDAATKGEYVEKGSQIKVLSVEADHIYIREIAENNKVEEISS
ncbi:MAG: hypothetical protein NE327_22405 [Lentisphaeraceae bacterium]|nr:hypothetical protein [Lentisphaeraceae bacterium]